MHSIAVACGDPTGIGPEVVLKAAASLPSTEDARIVLFGDRDLLGSWNDRLGAPLAFHGGGGAGRLPIEIRDPRPSPLPAELRPLDRAAADAALDYLRAAADACARGECSAMVTAPLSKEAILRTGVPFVGQTEWLAEFTGTPEVTMMLVGEDKAGRPLRVALVTTHVPLRRVADLLDGNSIRRAVRHAAAACRQLGIAEPRVAVCGLNPHAGEGGMLGDEELRLIAPALAPITEAQVTGPIAADTAFHAALQGRHDAVVAMYHDQGLGPLKTIAFDTGVNWTVGLPFPRTSPDHGTAFDIAGRGVADPSSMLAALRLALVLARGGGTPT